ncbi:hypothetical protein [Agromyces sp. ISL-38]|uniref:hypothetical protein n=1 Tax=Agromyces sp. ISL-38 TaxID=2819107 RepID=UPI0020365314|nr:hypothetical protein [Agromyces sp. ISL-38]
MENTSISEELIGVGRRPVPWVLIRRSEESFDEPFALLDRLEGEVAAQLLVPPPVEHVADGLFLRMEHANNVLANHPATVIHQHAALQPRAFNG